MTPLESEAVSCLGKVRFPVASWDKRFVRHLSGMDTITEKEAPQVWRLLKRYRRQVNHPNKRGLMDAAEMFAAPDFRKLAAKNAELERYNKAMQQ